MQNLRSFRDALLRCGRRFKRRSHVCERGGLRGSRFRSRSAFLQTNDSVFERLRALVPSVMAVYAVILSFGSLFHSSLHCHCDHNSDYVCLDFEANADVGRVVDEIDSHDEFDCPVCRSLAHNRSFIWLASSLFTFVVAFYFLRVIEQILYTVDVFALNGRAPPHFTPF